MSAVALACSHCAISEYMSQVIRNTAPAALQLESTLAALGERYLSVLGVVPGDLAPERTRDTECTANFPGKSRGNYNAQ
jgi:hypothetical protein